MLFFFNEFNVCGAKEAHAGAPHKRMLDILYNNFNTYVFVYVYVYICMRLCCMSGCTKII